jgi:hypothetical protein
MNIIRPKSKIILDVGEQSFFRVQTTYNKKTVYCHVYISKTYDNWYGMGWDKDTISIYTYYLMDITQAFSDTPYIF